MGQFYLRRDIVKCFLQAGFPGETIAEGNTAGKGLLTYIPNFHFSLKNSTFRVGSMRVIPFKISRFKQNSNFFNCDMDILNYPNVLCTELNYYNPSFIQHTTTHKFLNQMPNIIIKKRNLSCSMQMQH